MNLLKTISISAFLFGLNGCATVSNLFLPRVTLAYAGDPRPLDEVGVLFGDGIATIRKIDGAAESTYRRIEAIQAGGWGQIDLLPGEHTIEFCFRQEETVGTNSAGQPNVKTHYCKNNREEKLHVEKGRIYQAFFRNEGRDRWSVYFTDVTAKRKADVIDSREKLNKALSKP